MLLNKELFPGERVWQLRKEEQIARHSYFRLKFVKEEREAYGQPQCVPGSDT